MRVFIAVELPEKVKRGIAQVQERIKKTSNRIKWVDSSSMHITLKFLGEVSEDSLDGIYRISGEVAEEFSPFTIKIEGTGVFPDYNNPRVIWMGIGEGALQLAEIARKLEEKLHQRGFPRERRKWVPHLTLGRVKQLTDRENIRNLIIREEKTPGGVAEIREITVMQSRLTPQGAIYTPLQCFSLKGGKNE